jgi:hypothetical protein
VRVTQDDAHLERDGPSLLLVQAVLHPAVIERAERMERQPERHVASPALDRGRRPGARLVRREASPHGAVRLDDHVPAARAQVPSLADHEPEVLALDVVALDQGAEQPGPAVRAHGLALVPH